MMKTQKIQTKRFGLSFFVLCMTLLVGCTTNLKETNYNTNENKIVITESEGVFLSEQQDESDNDNTLTNGQLAETNNSKFDINSISKYEGKPYVEVNHNVPFFGKDEITTNAFEEYASLDYLGRSGIAYANICKEVMPSEKRGKIGNIHPSGWKLTKYNGVVDGNYLYNRCHLIGYQLAGENDNERNLITGTRYLNVEGMLPFENQIAAYVDETGNHVLYRVTPMFEGDNLVANGVLMEAYSVEDQGSGVSFNVFVYNVQPGIDIDYKNGDSYLIDEKNSFVDNNNPDERNDINNEENVKDVQAYVANTNTKKFHKSNCSSVMKMKEKNRKNYECTRDEMLSMGYAPCYNCNP